ncbi:hypothetical protein L1286_20135 [Pseudoalteromonas sp. SMS1]|uniref:hypothetical protein n=1 Tax=Pseudoalteromonas sp. SMS1 TaxID=2908894 RepID=UPI001F21AF84|nr:hypothetical protein [Pseudoalteromonas sp. SMS1]MCF2859795.1 hypothetical protein [Pseudoalteromonas sp. SMS1]
MKRLTFVLFSALGSANAIAQQVLNQHDKVYAELYANYVSKAAFVAICSKFDGTKNYDKPFNKWVEKNKEDIAKGRAILTRHYSAQGADIDELFNWKTDAEMDFFKAGTQQEKLVICNRVITSISPSE